MKALLTVLVLLATTLPGFPQTAGVAEAERSKLLALENAWNQAEKHKDAKALETLLDPDLIYVTYDGSMMTKVQYIASIKAPSLTPDQIVNESMTAYMHGDSAVVSGVYRENGVKNGTPYMRRGRFTDTWVYEGGQWMCVAGQTTLIAR
ncbi:MAG TPA: nuclear transport factor 2 family protein [Candidatus Polarisedimenticolia bacterium]|nr:nuclear transport factor 2 family protein [Candidatus Polarisedimenticolia bacterium]